MSDKIKNTDWVYDLETYRDLFAAGFVHVKSGSRFIFEVSERVNQSIEFVKFLEWLRDRDDRLFGYNNLGFDWPVCDHLMKIQRSIGYFTCDDAKSKQEAIFSSNNRWEHNVKPWEIMVTQGDLMKIHHFDNAARATSLKKLEINMRAARVVDLPYDPNLPTTSVQKDEIIAYMCHDINETMRFYLHSLDQINFRDDLALKHMKTTTRHWGDRSYTETKCELGDVLNFSDGKIGQRIIVTQLEEAGTQCYEKVNGRRKPIQTIRGHIDLNAVISPKVSFNHPEFNRISEFISSKKITPDQTKGFFGLFYTYVYPDGKIVTTDRWDAEEEKLFVKSGGRIIKGSDSGKTSCIVDGFQYDFGTGGIHGSRHSEAFHEDDEWEIWDWDVASYYPNLAITHNWFPEHLSEIFCKVYLGIYNLRQTFAKTTTENAMLKLALNVPYGESNSEFSPFYDPQHTMRTTINGQLLLCVLAELLTHIPKEDGTLVSISDCVKMLQINTDGLTVRIKKTHIEWMNNICAEWEKHTGLTLEKVRYKSMFIRDVNNYLAVKMDGKTKRIGAYAYETPLENPYTRERGWNQDHSMLVIRKAAEARMVHGTPVAEFIMNHRDPFDFQLSTKVNRKDRLETWTPSGDRFEIQRNTRYYVSTDGPSLMKVLPPLAKQFYGDKALISRQKYDAKRVAAESDGATDEQIMEWDEWKDKMERKTSVQAGWTVTITNDISDFRWDNVNWYFYIEEANKLVIGE